MDIHGDLTFSGDENTLGQIGNAGFILETDFPSSPKVGRIVFKDTTCFMCVALNGSIPIWIPITNKISTFIHDQTTGSATWTVNHNLNTTSPMLQVYDSNNEMVIPSTVTPLDNNNMTVTFGVSLTGRAIVMYGQILPSAGVGVLAPEPVAFTQSFTSLSTVVVIHNLGYFPIVRVFISGEEIQPQSVVHDSIFQTTVTFSSAQTGVIRMV